MSRPSTVKTTTLRLLLAATIVASAAPLPSFANVASTGEALTETDAPALPSSFYGSATLDGADVAEGTTISAWVDGVLVADTNAHISDGISLYVLDVPGDDPQTPALDGGYEGAVVVFKAAGYAAGDLALWHAGEVEELDLAAVQHDGPDLAVLVDNEQTETFSGDTLTYKIAVLNIGNQTATGVSLSDTLPEHVTFLAADQGGSESGGTVAWPTFDLEADGFAVRTVNVEVGNPLAAGVTKIANTVTASDDGAGGAEFRLLVDPKSVRSHRGYPGGLEGETVDGVMIFFRPSSRTLPGHAVIDLDQLFGRGLFPYRRVHFTG